MLIIINMTGLKKTYWLPVVNKECDKDIGIWYVDLKFICVQITVYNKNFGCNILEKLQESYTTKP